MTTDYEIFPPFPYKGRGWVITFEDDPFRDIGELLQDPREKEIVVYASSQNRAQYVKALILASYDLFLGSPHSLSIPEIDVFPTDIKPSYAIDETEIHFLKKSYYLTSEFPVASLIACKVSTKTAYQNALFKYQLSQLTTPLNSDFFHPAYWISENSISSYAKDRVKYAYSIILAYSVIEELNLEIRATSKKPSMINNQWNPLVLGDLVERLVKNGVDISQPITWVYRNKPTKIHQLHKPLSQQKADWAHDNIHDKKIKIVDAISTASWLRSKISAHKFTNLTNSLSYYDVFNVQELARHLLLAVLGFWQTKYYK